jgi:hypothetical protein
MVGYSRPLPCLVFGNLQIDLVDHSDERKRAFHWTTCRYGLWNAPGDAVQYVILPLSLWKSRNGIAALSFVRLGITEFLLWPLIRSIWLASITWRKSIRRPNDAANADGSFDTGQ